MDRSGSCPGRNTGLTPPKAKRPPVLSRRPFACLRLSRVKKPRNRGAGCSYRGVRWRRCKAARDTASDRSAVPLRLALRDFSGLLRARRRASNHNGEVPPFQSMKTSLLILSIVSAFALGACSRSDETVKASASPTPNPNLQRDAERLQQATANAAKERERSEKSPATPTVAPHRGPKADLSPRTVPPESPNPNP